MYGSEHVEMAGEWDNQLTKLKLENGLYNGSD